MKALLVGHPGHELRAYGWMEQNHPLVCVLTDGSGGAGIPRIQSTAAILERTGCQRGPVFGRYSDRAVYQVVMNGQISFFTALAGELAGTLAEHGVDTVAGDATEGYNSTHDVWRMIVDAAVARAGRVGGKRIANYEFALVGRPDWCPPGCEDGAVFLQLDDAAVQRKLAEAQGYPELAAEVEKALASVGIAAFATECFWPARKETEPDGKPFYETYGELQVKEGRYSSVIRYSEHIRPIAEALRAFARGD